MPPRSRSTESYWHTGCGKITTAGPGELERWRQHHPGQAWCAWCNDTFPTGAAGQFHWCDQDNIETQAPGRQPKLGTTPAETAPPLDAESAAVIAGLLALPRRRR